MPYSTGIKTEAKKCWYITENEKLQIILDKKIMTVSWLEN